MTEKAPPFFIVGCGRSGTSLLRGLLNGHPHLAIPLESLFIADYLRAAAWMALGDLKELITQEPEVREWGIQARASDLEGCSTIAEVIDRLHRLYAQAHGKARWGQKTPRLIRHLDLIQNHFPSARTIHIVRDPRAVVSSLMRSNVHRSTAWHGVRRWLRDVEAGLEFEQSHPRRVLRIKYEDLVEHPRSTMERLMRHLGLESHETLVEGSPGSQEYSEFYSSIHANLQRGVSSAFAAQWKNHLDADEVALIEGLAHSLMKRLGYETETAEPGSITVSPRPKLRTRLQRAAGLMLQIWRYLRYRRGYLIHLIRRKRRLGLLREFLSGINY